MNTQFSSHNKQDLEALDLIKELNNETAQVISGGQDSSINKAQPIIRSSIQITNATSEDINFDLTFGSLNVVDYVMPAWETETFQDPSRRATRALVSFDNYICNTTLEQYDQILSPGNYTFSLEPNGCSLNLAA
jgi:hypothetical protein